jgi:hypothetical protein
VGVADRPAKTLPLPYAAARGCGASESECAESPVVGERRRKTRRACRTGHVRSSDFGARRRHNGTSNVPALRTYGSSPVPLVLGRFQNCCEAGRSFSPPPIGRYRRPLQIIRVVQGGHHTRFSARGVPLVFRGSGRLWGPVTRGRRVACRISPPIRNVLVETFPTRGQSRKSIEEFFGRPAKHQTFVGICICSARCRCRFEAVASPRLGGPGARRASRQSRSNNVVFSLFIDGFCGVSLGGQRTTV